jgi:putative peptide zinc metalloprotease protein
LDFNSNNLAAHHSTVELANCKLVLRSDLSFHLQEFKGRPCYLIEDEFNSRFFRVGLAEYYLISLLDGSTTVSQAVSRTSRIGDQAISEQDAISICKWLIDSGLATTDASRTSGRLMEAVGKSDRRKKMATMNPVSPKFTLFNPDQWLSSLNPVVGWVFSFPMFLAWCAIVITAIYQVASHWDGIAGSQSMVLSRDNWIWLGLSWLALKLIHETAHGLACKRFGGDVRQCGLVLIVMIPLPFVDVTSSWRFPSKWMRIFVAAAGMYAEIFLASVAAIIWSYSGDEVVRQHAFNVMLAGSITTLLFNANPLMRFDGYYMLSDWLEMPNLGTHGQQWMNWVGRKYYLGLEEKKPQWPEGRGWIVATYAVLALMWRVIICVGLTLAAEALWFGAGIILALVAVILWVVWPALKLLKVVFIGEPTRQQPGRIRFCLLTAALFMLFWTVGTQVPWYARIKAPAIVDYKESFEVRTSVGGFLAKIHFTPGETVQRGQLLARLENVEVDADVEKLLIELKSNELRMRLFRDRELIAAYDVESKNREALIQRLAERRKQQQNLEIRSLADGIVEANELNSQLGAYFGPGQKLCTVESDARKEIHALVAQHDFELFEQFLGQPIDVHVWGTGPGYFQANLQDLNPRARVDVPHPALAATAGGPLPVKYRRPSTDESEPSEQLVELVDPHFLARVELSALDSRRLKSGQPAVISFRTSRGSIGEVVVERVSLWIRKLRKRNQTASLSN